MAASLKQNPVRPALGVGVTCETGVPAALTGEDGGVAATMWRRRLHSSLCLKADPLFVFPERIIPGECVWQGAQLWAEAFVENGLVPGDRIVLALDPSPAFLMVLTAALCHGLTVAPVAGGRSERSAELLEQFDARLVVGEGGLGSVVPDGDGTPPRRPWVLRSARGAATPRVCVLMQTSGTSGVAKTMALSAANLMSVVSAHMPALGLEGAVVLSLLPWHHSFGLIINLLPALFAGATVVREGTGGREVGSILEMAELYPPTHMSMVPLQAERLSESAEGMALLMSLHGGAVGGAPVGPELAEVLGRTRLRAGYGQTEASPGVCLGEPGVWCAGYIGKPLGCATRIGDGGVLEVCGKNVCLGHWEHGELVMLDPRRWLSTGDVVRRATDDESDGYVFVGRVDANIKLANGRLVEVGLLEQAIVQRMEGVSEAWVTSLDGHCLTVGVVMMRGAEVPGAERVAACLGVLADRFGGMQVLDKHALPRTGKGAVDRSKLGAVLAEKLCAQQ